MGPSHTNWNGIGSLWEGWNEKDVSWLWNPSSWSYYRERTIWLSLDTGPADLHASRHFQCPKHLDQVQKTQQTKTRQQRTDTPETETRSCLLTNSTRNMFYSGTSHCTTCTNVDLHLTQLSSDLYMNLNNFQHRAPRIPFSKPAIYKSHVFFCGRISGSTNKAGHMKLYKMHHRLGVHFFLFSFRSFSLLMK